MAQEVVGFPPDLLRFPKNFVDGLNDSAQLIPIVHTH